MKNVLITSGLSAFSQRIAKLLPDSTVFYADSKPIPIPFLKTEKYIAIPSPGKSSYVHEVLKVCLDISINILIPLGKEELIPLAKSRQLFDEYGIIVLLPDMEYLPHIPKLVNPTRANCKEVVLKGPHEDEIGTSGVFAINDDGDLMLCCIH